MIILVRENGSYGKVQLIIFTVQAILFNREQGELVVHKIEVDLAYVGLPLSKLKTFTNTKIFADVWSSC